jgi:methionyl-tRNA formyltransferase
MRIVFLGMTGPFSGPPLESLLAAGGEVVAVIIPAEGVVPAPRLRRMLPPLPGPSDLPLINPHLEPNILHLAWERHIPVWAVRDLGDPAFEKLLVDLQPDLGVVACFSRIIPPALLRLPGYGWLNLHPSRLPAYRGPAPLFWMARTGAAQAGVTLHFLDEGLDTGDIVAQTAWPWPEGISGPALEQRCAEAGAALLKTAVEQLAQSRTLPRRPQPAEGSSYFPWPGESDLLAPVSWSARRAFNFLRAAGPDWPLRIAAGEEQFSFRVVIDYDPAARLDQPAVRIKDELLVQFRPGVVRVKL